MSILKVFRGKETWYENEEGVKTDRKGNILDCNNKDKSVNIDDLDNQNDKDDSDDLDG